MLENTAGKQHKDFQYFSHIALNVRVFKVIPLLRRVKMSKTGPNQDGGVPTLHVHLAINAVLKVRCANMCYDVRPTFPFTDLVIFKNALM